MDELQLSIKKPYIEEFLSDPSPDDAKCKILQAATQAFALSGYHGASIRDISKLCGLKQPSIYHHFESKENLFRVVLSCCFERFMRFITDNMSENKGLEEDILSIVTALSDFNQRYENQILLITSLVFSSPPQIRQYFLENLSPRLDELVFETMSRYQPLVDFDTKLFSVKGILRNYTLSLALPELPDHVEMKIHTEEAVRYILSQKD